MFPTGPKAPSQVSLGPSRLNDQKAVDSYEIYIHKVVNFILGTAPL